MNQSRTTRTALLAAMALAMTVGSMTAEARPGSVSSSRSSSVSSPARSAPAMTSTRAGGGTSSGMSRSSVMTTARQQSPANVAAQPAPSRNYASGGGSGYGGGYNGNSGYNNNAPAPANRGFSGGQLAGAAAAGAVGGYLLHGATQPNQPVVVNNGAGGAGYGPSGAAAGYAPAGGGYAPAPAYAPAYAGSSGGMGVFGFLIILALLGAGGYVLYRKFGTPATTGHSGMGSFSPAPAPRASAFAATPTTSTSPNMTIENELLNSAPKNFRGIQDAYSRNDRFAVAALVDDSYLGQFTADMTADAGNPATVVHSVKVVGGQVLGFEQQDARYVGSIHFQADISEGNGPSQEIEEVWHFVRPIDGGTWKLAGIEQV